MKRLFTYFLLAASVLAAGAQDLSHSLKHQPLHEIYANNTGAVCSSILPSATINFFENRTEDSEDYDFEMANDMINYAKKFLGTRYRRGGKTPAGFDCSGFTSYVFRQFGYSLGASSRDQALQGQAVAKEDVLPGDILVFNGRRIGGTVGHVGIAIAYDHDKDEITFIHSANGGGIRIDKTSAPYYKARYIGARRMLK